jgi:hypothetical protein
MPESRPAGRSYPSRRHDLSAVKNVAGHVEAHERPLRLQWLETETLDRSAAHQG